MKVCQKNGMQLYNPESSVAAKNVLIAFGQSTFASFRRAEVYIFGRRKNRCKSFNGNGKIDEVSCFLPFNFICEFVQQPIGCPSYSTDYTRAPAFHDAATVTNPKTCEYHLPIDNDYTVIISGGDVPKESIIQLDMENTPEIRHLPIKIAQSFPNLNSIYCTGCEVTTITAKSLQGLAKLKLIVLDNAKIIELNSAAFVGLNALLRIDLGKLNFNQP
jgi:hypothetical protein